MAAKAPEIGAVTGLAFTEVGGVVLTVEVTPLPGKGQLTLTGQLGDVMKESAQAAWTFIRAYALQLGIEEDFYDRTDLHIHVPEGAIPKDGPSAGVTMATAMASALAKRAVRADLAMTGEITLRGNVLPIGGVKEKVLAAHRAGIKVVFLPEENRKDLEDVPENVRKVMEFHFMSRIEEVLKLALLPLAHSDEVAGRCFGFGAFRLCARGNTSYGSGAARIRRCGSRRGSRRGSRDTCSAMRSSCQTRALTPDARGQDTRPKRHPCRMAGGKHPCFPPC